MNGKIVLATVGIKDNNADKRIIVTDVFKLNAVLVPLSTRLSVEMPTASSRKKKNAPTKKIVFG